MRTFRGLWIADNVNRRQWPNFRQNIQFIDFKIRNFQCIRIKILFSGQPPQVSTRKFWESQIFYFIIFEVKTLFWLMDFESSSPKCLSPHPEVENPVNSTELLHLAIVDFCYSTIYAHSMLRACCDCPEFEGKCFFQCIPNRTIRWSQFRNAFVFILCGTMAVFRRV